MPVIFRFHAKCGGFFYFSKELHARHPEEGLDQTKDLPEVTTSFNLIIKLRVTFSRFFTASRQDATCSE